MKDEARKSPEYGKPPVCEVAMGVQFEKLENFTAVHPGLFWESLRDQYPRTAMHAPLADAIENFGDERPNPPQPVVYSVPPLPRCWFLDESENRLIQLQENRFHHNWRKVRGDEDYPRYKKIRSGFEKTWRHFLDFIKHENIGEFKPNHWELTYVNHLYQGECWESMADLPDVFACWSGESSEKYLPVPENVAIKVTHVFPKQLARLHISVEPRTTVPEHKKLLRVTLTARGRLESASIEDLMNCMDIGHEWIVWGFTDFTTSKAHKIWERKEVSANDT